MKNKKFMITNETEHYIVQNDIFYYDAICFDCKDELYFDTYEHAVDYLNNYKLEFDLQRHDLYVDYLTICKYDKRYDDYLLVNELENHEKYPICDKNFSTEELEKILNKNFIAC